MKKIIVISIFMILVAGFNLAAVNASETIASIDWKITNLTDMQHNTVSIPRPVLSLDVDFGRSFFNLYGCFGSEDGLDDAAAQGAGYIYHQNDKVEIRMDVRSGTKLYRLHLDMNTLSGTCAVYDNTGAIESVGSVDMVKVY